MRGKLRGFLFFGTLILWNILIIGFIYYGLQDNIFSSRNDLFLTTATIIGTFLAIFVSIILLIIQESSNKNNLDLINKIKKDYRLYLTIFVAIFSILFSFGAYLFGGILLINFASVSFILSFSFIILYFIVALNLINPFQQIKEISKDCKREISKVVKLFDKKIKKSKEVPAFLKPFSVSASLSQDGKLGKRIRKIIDEYIGQLKKIIKIEDDSLFESSFDELKNILETYFKIKKVDLPEDPIITHTFERMKYLSYPLFKEMDHFKLLILLDAYKNLAISSLKNLKTINIQGINYQSSLAMEYISQIAEKAKVVDDLDLLRECIYSIRDIGLASIEKNNSTSMAEHKISGLNELDDSGFIHRASVHSINRLYTELVKSKTLNYFGLNEEIEKVFNHALKNTKNYINLHALTVIFFGELAKDSFRELIYNLINKAKNPPEQIAANNYETTSKKEINDILILVSKMVSNLKKVRNYHFNDEISFLFSLIYTLSKEKLITKKWFVEEIELAINILDECYQHSDYLKTEFRKNFSDMLDQLEKEKEEKKIINQLNELKKKWSKDDNKTK